MALRIFNTQTGQKEPFQPIREDKVGMYVCGVTVYDLCHIGHARSAIVFDTIYRYLKYKGYPVTYVRNFTDIDDKIIKRANEEGIGWQEVTEKYIAAFYEDMDRLNILRPDVEPKATDHIQEMLDLINGLIAKDRAYEVEGDVYFAVRAFPEYGKLSGKNVDDLRSGARVEVDDRKRDPLDFALWKKSKEGEPFWESPWGCGRPGWHIECSAMSEKYLGNYFDIHGGGKDLVFPHHENEIAQSCGCSGEPFVKTWLHNGFVNINQEKMSKSLGNFFTIRDLLEKFHPEVLRLFLLTNHYRGPIDFADSYLDEAIKMLDRFYELYSWMEENRQLATIPPTPDADAKIKSLFDEAMDDDFNAAAALGHMNEELRRLNKLCSELPSDSQDWTAFDRDAAGLFAVGQLVGLFHRSPGTYREESLALKTSGQDHDTEKIETLVEEREAARKAKNWAEADRLRDELDALGVVLKDTPKGPTWTLK
ncbi:MAG: cysteine--tRNA ligase [Candidatus Nitronauta litoralis]|uniref:Cysteine--tRNA ligase n=1 Tax=Candidatus Nitronauta litoralis TaxID=2705533 RepID=A0A7T0BW08_9BACT|nr:MAG: cysteine--tRNA ligase [Candidatus Nitronauta litoralis]